MAFLEIKNLKFTYPSQSAPALDGVDISAERGDFVLLCGSSGCGKTTLLRMIKRQLTPVGKLSGEILIDGAPASLLSEKDSVRTIGMVMQDPDSQIVTEKVWHELAFGLEGLGENTGAIRRKTAEICGFLGIGELFRRNTDELSGGEKQLVCLASVLATRPDILLLDEPSGQLDPIAAEKFLTLLRKLTRETGTTVILAEHHTENVFEECDKVIILEKGKSALQGTPKEIAGTITGEPEYSRFLGFLPASARLFALTGGKGECPLSVRDGKNYVKANFPPCGVSFSPQNPKNTEKELISVKDVTFRYRRESEDVLRGVSLCAYEDEILFIFGENGSGKSTLLKIMAGLYKPVSGKVLFSGKNTAVMKDRELYKNGIGYLPQNPKTVFTESDLLSDLKLTGKNEEDILRTAEKLGITGLLSCHPYDLSGGETQRAAIAKLLLSSPRLLLLDEPAKGLDHASKQSLGEIFAELKSSGVTVCAVTHDTEFAAEYADRCAFVFDGSIMSVNDPVTFFSENNYLTTPFSKMTRDICPDAVTERDAANACKPRSDT